MPFSKDDTWRVTLALGLSQNHEAEIETRLQITEQRSELLVKRVLAVLERIEKAEEEKDIASTEEAGIIEIGGGQAGGIKYSEKRVCVVKSHLGELRQTLANLIGFVVEVGMPF